jgi:hypothetical protein
MTFVVPYKPSARTYRKHVTWSLLLLDVTAYAEVCLRSRCLETGCITPLFYCWERVLLSNGSSYGSAVLAWSKYAIIYYVCPIKGVSNYQLSCHSSDILLALQPLRILSCHCFSGCISWALWLRGRGLLTLIFGKCECGNGVDTLFTAKPFAGWCFV